MNFSYTKFLKPLGTDEKNIRVYDNSNVLRYILNPFVTKTVYVRNNILYVSLDSSKVTLDFSSLNEANQAAKKLQEYIDAITNSKVPYWIQQAVEVEAQYYTKGPTGSTGLQGDQGDQGLQGPQGYSSYDVWVQTGNTGTVQQFLESLRGPIGLTGPMSLGDSRELLIEEQTIFSTIDDKDIQIVTKGAGNLLFKMDRDGWVVNYGISNNNQEEIWSSGIVIDDEGNIYVTGGDFTSLYTWITKFAPNGNIIWQKQLDRYSQGESIVYSNNNLYVLLSDQSDPDAFGNISIIKLNKNGILINIWNFDLNSYDAGSSLYNVPYGYDITVDDLDNIYYTGVQSNFSNGIDIIIGKLNTTTETIEWQRIVDGGVGFDDRGFSIKFKNDHIYVVGALFNGGNSPNVRADIFITKYDKDGTKVWSKVIGNQNTYQEGLCISVDSDGSLYVAGFINHDSVPGNPITGPYNNFYIKLDQNGNTLWTKAIDGFNRSIVDIEVDGDGIFAISTQSTTSVPARTSTDLILFKISKSTGDIIWQQYISTLYRDSVWANIPPIGAAGHKVLASDSTGKAVYISGLTKDGNTQKHNAFIMSYDQKSLPVGTYSNWQIEDANFSTTDINIFYTQETSNVTGILFDNKLLDNTEHSVTSITSLTFSNIDKDSYFNVISPNTELFVRGIINIDNNYILPRSRGESGQVLTYVNNESVLVWQDQSMNISFNDYETISYRILGTSSMDGLYNDPVNGLVDGNFDDQFFTVNLPFDIYFMGNTYSTVYVGSNSYMTFGAGFSAFSGYTSKNPPLPGIFIESDDRSLQKIYTHETYNRFTIRYEGSVLPTGPSLAPVELAWEATFNKDSGVIDVSIDKNMAYGTGFSCIKKSDSITKVINTATASSFRIFKGYGLNTTNANGVYYKNIKGLSYSIVEDPNNVGQSFVSIDFNGLDDITNSSFTTFGTTGSNTTIINSNSWSFQSGIELNKDEFIKTNQLFSGEQGLFMQVKLPVMTADEDRIKLGFKKSNGQWSANIELVYDFGTVGNIIVRNTLGGVVTYAQSYNLGDILTIYSDGNVVYFQLNGVTVQTCPFITSPSDTYYFTSETYIQNTGGFMLSYDYTFTDFKFYPTGRGEGVYKKTSDFDVNDPTIVYNTNLSSVWYHDSVAADYIADFTNLSTNNGQTIKLVVVINQGVTPYMPTTIKIDGNTQTVKWLNGTPTSNSVDYIEFAFIRVENSWKQILGQIKTFM